VNPLRIGTLGTSRISGNALLEPSIKVPEVTVAAVAARDKDRAEAFALRHAIPSAYGSYDELLADPDIDAIYNPLPNSLHGPWTLKAIAAGKHVLCEKPFASDAGQAEQVATAAAAAGRVVMEAMHYRYHPLIRRLAEVVAELGPVQHLQCWTSFVIEDPEDIRYDYDLAGGALMDGGCYAIDCLRLLGGGEPSVSGALADPWPSSGDADPGQAADRAVAVRLAFPGGATGWFESAFTRTGEFRADVHVSCRDGQVWLQNFILAHLGRLVATREGSLIADEQGGGDTTYTYQLRAFAAAVEANGADGADGADGAGPGGDPLPTSAAEAVPTMRVIDGVYRAAGLAPRP
jgi:predicted dehydrogenase